MNKNHLPPKENFLQLEGNLMLRSFAVQNFQSFKDRAEISFSMTKREKSDEWFTERPSGELLGTVLGIWGANASGKSSFLKAMAFLTFFLEDSFGQKPTSKIPLENWFDSKEPTCFEVVWSDDAGTTLTYILEATTERVLKESLTRRAKGKGGLGTKIFNRTWMKEKQEYAVSFGQFSETFLGKYHEVAVRFRPNASFISSFLQHNSNAQLKIFTRSESNTTSRGHLSTEQLSDLMTGRYFRNEELLKKVRNHLQEIDLGLNNVKIKTEKVKLPPSVLEKIAEDAQRDPDLKKLLEEGAISLEAYGVHDIGDGKEKELPLNKESDGTRGLYALLGLVLPFLEKGGYVIIDELDNDLHPRLVEYLLELFNTAETNPGKAQLIFVSHNPRFMGRIGKSHIWLTEKIEGKSEIYPLSEMGNVRADENFEAKYFGGAYGSVPFKK